MTEIGNCKLCLAKEVPIRNSHLLPAALYRLLRDDTSTNPNPWLISAGREVQSSRQETARLLCHDCEQRFSKQGETWVFRNGFHRDNSFPLAKLLSRSTPVHIFPKTRVYHAVNLPKVDVGALAYFAASIFWRSSVWPSDVDYKDRVRLGPFDEAFRGYLLNRKPFPADAALAVIVREESDVTGSCHAPQGGKQGNMHVFSFAMPGFSFMLFVSRHLEETYKRLSILQGGSNPIFVSSMVESYIRRGIIAALP